MTLTEPANVFAAAAGLPDTDAGLEFMRTMIKELQLSLDVTAAELSPKLEEMGVGWCDENIYIRLSVLRSIIAIHSSTVSISLALAQHGWILADGEGKLSVQRRWQGRLNRYLAIPFKGEGSATQWHPVPRPPLDFMARMLIQKFGVSFVAVAMNIPRAKLIACANEGAQTKRLDAERLMNLYEASSLMSTP